MVKRIKGYAYLAVDTLLFLYDIIGWAGLALALAIGGFAGFVAGLWAAKGGS